MTTADNIINTEALRKILMQTLNNDMAEAAEPILQEALKKLEVTMREQLASRLIGLIEQNFSMERFGTDIRITLRQVLGE